MTRTIDRRGRVLARAQGNSLRAMWFRIAAAVVLGIASGCASNLPEASDIESVTASQAGAINSALTGLDGWRLAVRSDNTKIPELVQDGVPVPDEPYLAIAPPGRKARLHLPW